MDQDLEILPGLLVPAAELQETHSRAGGPGGQHVNTTSTRVTLRWCLVASAIPEAIKARLAERLARRLTREGEILIHADAHRSQLQNREAARERLAAILREALAERTPRRPTRPTRSSQTRRMDAKRARGSTKKLRGRVGDE